MVNRDLGNTYTVCKLPLITAIRQLNEDCPLPPVSTGTSGGQYYYLIFFLGIFNAYIFHLSSTGYKFNLLNGPHLKNTFFFFLYLYANKYKYFLLLSGLLHVQLTLS